MRVSLAHQREEEDKVGHGNDPVVSVVERIRGCRTQHVIEIDSRQQPWGFINISNDQTALYSYLWVVIRASDRRRRLRGRALARPCLSSAPQ